MLRCRPLKAPWIPEPRNAGAQEPRNAGSRNPGMLVPRNRGMLVPRSGGVFLLQLILTDWR